MTKKHDDIFDDVLSGLPKSKAAPETKAMGGARFLKRTSGLADRLSGNTEEKTLRWIDPSEAVMWDQHNRDYALLNEDNCADLIDGIKSQGKQEFPAIVRARAGEDGPAYEVICGARRHFAISWLRANNYPQFKYLVEIRDLTDEEAFRLADIENRDRADISDYERALDYASAIARYYGGKQKAMAERLEVTEAWLSRFLQMAKMPSEIVDAFFRKTEIKEIHARNLRALMLNPKDRQKILAEASNLREEQELARKGQGAPVDAAKVLSRLKSAIKSKPKPRATPAQTYQRTGKDGAITFTRKGKKVQIEFAADIKRAELGAALEMMMNEHFPSKLPIGKK